MRILAFLLSMIAPFMPQSGNVDNATTNTAEHNRQQIEDVETPNIVVDDGNHNVDIRIGNNIYSEDPSHQPRIVVNLYGENGRKLKIAPFDLQTNLTMDDQVFGSLPGDATVLQRFTAGGGAQVICCSLETNFMYTQQNISKFITMFNSEQCRGYLSQRIGTQARIRITVEQ